MRSYILFFLIMIAALPCISAYDPVFLANMNTISTDLRTSIDIYPSSSNYMVDYVIANVSFMPVSSENQDVLSFFTNPAAAKTSKGVSFYWKRPSDQKLSASINSVVESRRWQPEINEKVAFPISQLDPALITYTKPSPMIDSDNPYISQLASQIANGEDDLYVVVFKVANWTKNNIDYNLSTLDSNVSLPASGVLERKQGVCGDLTDVFIAMLRSLGIPARFVTGIAYTDSPLFPDKWGVHGWAEVYFPGYGWVPFDVTYGEFGYLDASHVKSSVGFGPEDTRIEVSSEGLGRNFKISASEISISSAIVSSKGIVTPDFSMSAEVMKDNVGFGSYDLVSLTLQNFRDYYVSTEITAGNTSKLHIDNPKRNILLSPQETRVEYFLLRVDDGLDKRYTYTFPVSFYDQLGNQVSASFKSEHDSPSFDRSFFSGYVNPETRNFVPGLDIKCFPLKEHYYDYEQPSVNCTVSNTGNTYLTGISVCSSSCIKFDLPISQEYIFTLPVSLRKGQNELQIVASGDGIASSSSVGITLSDIPDLVISNLTYPKSIRYGSRFNVSFMLEKRSLSAAKNVSVSIAGSSLSLKNMDTSRFFIVEMKADGFDEGENSESLKIQFEDDRGRVYFAEKQVEFIVEKMSLWQKFLSMLAKLFS